MLKVNVYNTKGSRLKDFALPKDFYAPVNVRLLAQALRVYEAGRHFGLAKTKTRSEVARTKKKWYRQKGTGGARHGARSAPIFVGGGVAHGPSGAKRKLSLSAKTKKKALRSTISAKGKKGEMVILDGIAKVNKTSQAALAIKELSDRFKGSKKITLVLSFENRMQARLFRNLKNLKIYQFSGLNAYSIFYGGLVIFDRQIFEKKKVSPPFAKVSMGKQVGKVAKAPEAKGRKYKK